MYRAKYQPIPMYIHLLDEEILTINGYVYELW